ncbi:CAMK family protein kinase [Tritrichomonas foetus]|uniref:CAMK family protein kinase n=1 Tax=Tritrichomonas foetus TaxID=1144522 RepID=A0A1J4JHK0_9EUKA|nr:CAMK family protein kinase [Tritrichomonas foetus]|eukprot:OHS97083.1 CAMK family protein kinase [Tritrichomonas foetus]
MSRISHPRQIRQYTLTNELGSGSYSVVCKAFNKQNRRNFAVKIFPKTNLSEPGEAERFQREINSMACLRHDNLVALYDFFWDDKNFYMVIDYCPGGELFNYIVEHDRMEEPVAALIFKQIASAISFCHQRGVAHRDLKPENVLIDRYPHIKVSDFGLCGFINNDQLMQTFCGSPAYCAPECLAKKEYDGRLSDVWSLGTILYSMVTGDNPWNYSNTTQMIHQILAANYTVPDYVSESCKDLIQGMLRVNPDDRISVEDILEHPWLELANEANVKMPPKPRDIQGQSQLPPLRDLSMGDLHSLMVKSSNQTDSGIYSPFEKMGGDEEEDGNERIQLKGSRMPSLPSLCVRSPSIENFAKTLNPNGPSPRNKRFRPLNLSLGANRQRSANTLLPKMPHSPSPSLIGTIEE